MIRHLEHNNIDKKKWDLTIAECGNVYAYSWYLDIVHPDWEALVEDDYQSVMPLTEGKKFGINYLYQPYFVQQLGVFSKKTVTLEKTDSFLKSIPSKYKFAEIRLNESNTFNDGFQGVDYHRNVLLDLNQDYEIIKANYHTNTKRNLAKAESYNLQLVYNVIPYHVVALFRDNRGATLEKWGDKEYSVLISLGKAAMMRQSAFILGVNEVGDGEILCAALFMKANGRITFLFSGLNEKGRERQAMTYLLDQVIKQNAVNPLFLDFEGSDDENLARFYLGFGGHEIRYPSYAFNKLNAIEKSVLKLWKKF